MEEKRPVGRPRTQLDMEEIMEKIAMGVTKTRIAKDIGLSRRALYDKLEEWERANG